MAVSPRTAKNAMRVVLACVVVIDGATRLVDVPFDWAPNASMGLLVSTSLYAASGNADKTNNKKVVICHFPPDNPDKASTLSVAKPALNAHLAHGDRIGACGYNPVISSNGYLLGPLQSGFSLATLVAVFGLVSLPGLARRRRDGTRR